MKRIRNLKKCGALAVLEEMLYVTMSLNNFEDAITQGKAQWVTSLTHEVACGHLVLALTHNPENSVAEKFLEFENVSNVKYNWFDRDDLSIETLNGAHHEKDASLNRYVIVTDQREIEFYTLKAAKIRHV